MEPQKELFDDFNTPGTKQLPLSRGALPNKEITLTFAYDKLILALLGAALVLALVFIYGFECGRKSRMSKVQAPIKKQTIHARAQQAPTGMPRPYTIQAATYKSKELAIKDARALKNKGYPVTIIGINGQYEILIGEYADPKEAAAVLNALKKLYKKDCFVRKR